MPPRWLSLCIVVFWLVVTGRLLWFDLRPRFDDSPPPFTIDLVEEAQTRRPFTLWTVHHNGERAFQVRTKVTHPARDVFELDAEYRPIGSLPTFRLQLWNVERM